MREAIASAIESRGGFAGARVLDLYAGTGAMAFEAISRGAERAVLVERDPKVARAIAASAAELGIGDRCAVVVADLAQRGAIERVARAAGGAPFERVFADPPYASIEDVPPLLVALRAHGLIADDAILAVEHAKRHAPSRPAGFETISEPRYGDTVVLFLTPTPTAAAPDPAPTEDDQNA